MEQPPTVPNSPFDHLIRQDSTDSRRFFIAMAAAILAHASLFALRLPELELDRRPTRSRKAFVVRPIDFPPIVTKPTEIPTERRRRVPIPDPTPDSPEPLWDGRMIPPLPEAPEGLALSHIPSPPPPPASGEPIPFHPEMRPPVRIAGFDPEYTEIARRART